MSSSTGGKSPNHLGSKGVTKITDKRTIITAREHNSNGKYTQVVTFRGQLNRDERRVSVKRDIFNLRLSGKKERKV